MERGFPDSSDEAETLLLDAIANSETFGSADLASLCAARPDLAAALRALYSRLEQGRNLVGALNPMPDALGNLGVAAAEQPADPELRYRVVREIARGGMSIILEVWDSRLRRHMAMKRLRPVELGMLHGSIERERRRGRLFHEAQVLAQLAHPGIVPMYDVARDQHGEPYFTMLLVRGEDLGAIFRRTWESRDGWNLGRAVGVLQRVCESVAYAHEKGVIHRDLKPANVMVGAFGETYVMDWGLARAQGGVAPASLPIEGVREESRTEDLPALRPSSVHSLVRTDRADVRHASGSSPLLTQEGDVVGTPAYMSPEQAAGRLDEVGASTDVYSAGAMLYELLAQHAPYCDKDSSRSPHDVLHAVRRASPASIGYLAHTAPDELIAICERAMARDPAQRYASMRALSDDLRAFLENRVVRAHRTGALVELRKWVSRNRWAAATIGVALVATIGVAAVQSVLKRDVERAQAETAARAETLRRQDYFHSMGLAAAALTEGKTGRARELLEHAPEDLRGWEWRFLSSRVDTSDLVIRVDASRNRDARWTPDGCSIVAHGSLDGVANQLLLFDADTGALVRVFDSFRYPQFGTPSFSADGAHMVLMGRARELCVWDTSTWTRRASVDVQLADEWPNAACSPVGNLVAVYGSGPTEIWDIARRARVAILDAGQGHCTGCWSPDGSRFYTGAWNGSIAVWDMRTFDLIRVLRGHGDRVNGVAASPDGRWLASGGWERRVFVWDLRSFEIVHRTEVLDSDAGVVAWSPDSSRLVTSDGSNILVMAAGTWNEETRLSGHEASTASLAFDATGRRLLSTGADGTLRVWDLQRPDRWPADGPKDLHGRAPRFSRDGRWMADLWFASGQVDLWSCAERTCVRTLRFGRRIDLFDMTHDAGRLLVRFDARSLRIVDPWKDRVLGTISGASLGYAAHNPDAVRFSPEGDRVSVVGADGSLSVWDASSCQRMWRVDAFKKPDVWPWPLGGGAWSPDGKRIVTLCSDGRVQLWNATRGELIREWRGRMPWSQRALFSSDGRRLFLAGGISRGLECWDLESGQCSWERAQDVVSTIAIGDRDRRLFCVVSPRALQVLETSTGQEIVTLDLDPFVDYGLAVSPVDDLIVTTSVRGLRFWDHESSK